jgi:uracil-DNA glycosylase family 4
VAGSAATRLAAPEIGAIGPAWKRLTQEIGACTRCPLHLGRTHVVVYRGGPHPSVVFIGEAPGRDEDRVGRPFVGRAGRALDRAIGTVGLAPEEVGIVNLIKCRPPDNRFDPVAERTCRGFLDRQLHLLRPAHLVTLGRYALHALVPAAPPITEAAGFVQHGPLGPVFPLIHPAAPMHAPRYAARWEHDLTAMKAWLASSSTQTS